MGGNIFKGTRPIKLDHINPTLEGYFAELANLYPKKAHIFNIEHFIPLGSVGKKAVSGDIDLGIDISHILTNDLVKIDDAIVEWGLEPKHVWEEFLTLSKRSRTASYEMLITKAFLKTLANDMNNRGSLVFCSVEKTTNGNLFSMFPQQNELSDDTKPYVQIDWMVGDIEWLKFSCYSAEYPEHSNVKGLHRTQLLLSAFQIANLSFNHTTGVKDKETGLVIATDPESALNELGFRLGITITREDAESYFKLGKLLANNLPLGKLDTLLDTYLKILDKTRADIPHDLQTEWVFRRERLGLTGKFLPDSSFLKAVL